jgi:hypothetical protein
MADRLARHAEHPAELFLADALARGERAIGDRLDQSLIGAVDQRRLVVERLQRRDPAILNSEFYVTASRVPRQTAPDERRRSPRGSGPTVVALPGNGGGASVSFAVTSQLPLPAGAETLASILRTEDLTVRFGGLTALNQVNFKASETKGLALDVFAPPTR